ncbi:DUF1800 domain-containing protein [Pandoraea sp.]|uniref:DUF1800 domain-containing protein n=1 Tax=Pandoraea sp. TaxID=1883445 RepID=UPI001200A33B|nr:DUF1800 domain-containing protein [Pandoraea sp.]TAL53491.1 MAG: DUF1800 domain-containing protein [Pandoraea sp.]TAM14967.1 MAG: DUF1800 domain-containing protein [Pandoraea sp.]
MIDETNPSGMTAAAIAVNRFGLGARADEAAPQQPKAWLLRQFDTYQRSPPALAAQPGSVALATDLGTRRQQIRQSAAADKVAARKALNQTMRGTYRAAVDARVENALVTPAPFVERLVYFWSNHFAVSVENPAVAGLAGSFETEAIRPHVLGRFEDMLLAVEQHPAMQIFLNQTNSIGPDSMAARRAQALHPGRKFGLNENLGREIMELHTLGVRSGYTQADVTEFSRALTGWSIVRPAEAERIGHAPGTFIFRAPLHEPGVRHVMGRTYGQAGEAQPLAILRDFAASPATAHHLAEELARHFVADTPPPALVARLADTFLRSRGDLPAVYRTLVEAPEAWSPAAKKFKTPWEWTISSLRGLGFAHLGQMHAAPLLRQLGQPVWQPGSPAGYDDIAASWAAPDALVRRVEFARRLAAQVGDRRDPRSLGKTLLLGSLSPSTAAAVAHADTAATGLALLLVSPDFLRR